MSWLHGNFLWFAKFMPIYCAIWKTRTAAISVKKEMNKGKVCVQCQFPPRGFERFLLLLLKYFHQCRMFCSFPRSHSPYPLTQGHQIWTFLAKAEKESYCSSFKSISFSSGVNGGWSWGKMEALLPPTYDSPLHQLVWVICLGMMWMSWSSICICACLCNRSSWKGGKLSPHHSL